MSCAHVSEYVKQFSESMIRLSSAISELDITDETPKTLSEAEKRLAQREAWHWRGIPPRYYGAEWGNWIADTQAKQIAIGFARQAWSKNLFFTGKNGTGKTHLAMCLAKDGATYRRLPDIFREVREDFDLERETLEHLGEVKLLIIDEVGRQKFSSFEVNLFFDIIDRRWNNVLPTLLITNLSVKEFSEAYGNAIIDRLRPTIVNFDWESRR